MVAVPKSQGLLLAEYPRHIFMFEMHGWRPHTDMYVRHPQGRSVMVFSVACTLTPGKSPARTKGLFGFSDLRAPLQDRVCCFVWGGIPLGSRMYFERRAVEPFPACGGDPSFHHHLRGWQS